MSVEAKIKQLGLVLPAAIKLPAGVVVPISLVKVRGNMAHVSGHLAQNPDGSLMEPFGRVGAEVTLEQGIEAARVAGLSLLGSLQRALGDLDRIETWISAFGMVNGAPDFYLFPVVINGFSNLIIELFGPEVGSHARSAIGVGGLPFNSPVEIEAVVELKP